MPKELFMGVEIVSGMMCFKAEALSTHAPDDSDSDRVVDAGDYQPDLPASTANDIQEEIDALHVYVARSMRALDDVLTSLVKMCPTPVVEQSVEQCESGLSNYQPRVDGSDELLNLSHVRIDAFRLAKQAQRLAYLYSKIGVPDESA